MKENIVILDSERTSRELLSKYLNSRGFISSSFNTIQNYQKSVPGDSPDLLIVEDEFIPSLQSFRAHLIESSQKTVPVLLLTNQERELSSEWNFPHIYGTIHRMMGLPEIVTIIEDTLLKTRQNQISGPYSRFNIIGTSLPMQHLFEIMDKISASPSATVLIRGASGTGKELIARALHYNSVISSQPFVEINCAALPENLLESELFGYEQGAFTDARQTKRGLLELAQGGTFFMDEIGELSLQLQVKLLKVIEEKMFRRLGGVKNIAVTMRIITATNRNIEKLIEEKKFRDDLYYRLNVISLNVPPLKDRGDDLILLSNHFIEYSNQIHHKNIKGITSEALQMLFDYPWPGNVREFKNAIERAVLLENGNMITVRSLQLGAGHIIRKKVNTVISSEKIDVEIPAQGVSLDEIEKAYLEKALILAKGNQSKAARLLKLSREKFRYRCKKYDLSY
jgi:two-component system response regulator AtoC